jgi:hypothetical protein
MALSTNLPMGGKAPILLGFLGGGSLFMRARALARGSKQTLGRRLKASGLHNYEAVRGTELTELNGLTTARTGTEFRC